ncbi:MAG TPA: amidase family protein [Rhizomicrobium sp.]|jgi:amidase|nr:amidase family protein [Rhizomicrobium sp.]
MTAITYASARDMLAKLKAKKISARELLDAHVARHEQVGPKINAVVATDLEAAYSAARAIDETRASGKAAGVLAGLSMTIKDGFDVENMPATAGAAGFAHRAKNCEDAELVRRARSQGAVIWGKTNVPYMLGDWQSYNAIYGTTNNPYNVTRVPGGSSGGAAAALASGITTLEIGSDIGGSLRCPASFCGVYSLKPTWGVLPMRGHIPPAPDQYYECDLGVGGPMARNVEDLRLLWNVLSGATSSRKDVKEMRVAIWDEDPNFPLARDVRDGVARVGDALHELGVHVEHVTSPVDTARLLTVYRWLLAPILAAGFPSEFLEQMETTRGADKRAMEANPDPWSPEFNRVCWTARYYEVARALAERQELKDRLAVFFNNYDAILMPVTPVTAFPHDHSEAFLARRLDVDGTSASYMNMLCWIALATVLHSPAIALPAAPNAAGLPVGVQLVGPVNGEDRLFDLAAAAEEVLGGFRPPPL